MNAMSEVIHLGEPAEFFAPVNSDLIDSLVGQYRSMHNRVCEVANIMTGEIAGAVSYFFEGNGQDSRYGSPSVEKIFQKDGAISALNSAYWSKAMHLTDVLNYMPQKRRDEWNKSITEKTCPEFEEKTVRDTLLSMLNMRSQFFAERVDGIFRGLSGEHVTNSPAAFGKRMIIARVLTSYNTSDHSTCGLINDLRCVIAKFMGRDEPGYSASQTLVNVLKGRWGEWVSIDGGALKIRLYKKGTAHLEVHPDMAWRLNATLAHLYPTAIPPEFRQKPKRRAKEIDLILRPLPFSVIDLIAGLRSVSKRLEPSWPERYIAVPNAWRFDCGTRDKHAEAEAEKVLASIGAVKVNGDYFQFGYPADEVLDEIVASGCIPDQKAFQFYPTPEALAMKAVSLAEIEHGHTCLEPSAGTGALADLMPMDRTTCVEISELHHKILAAKGFKAVWNDFLPWADVRATEGKSFDRVIMNPPFDRGQWKAHLEAAASLVAKSGRLVLILPSGAKSSTTLPGFSLEWHGPFDNAFSGTSVSVVILVADRAA